MPKKTKKKPTTGGEKQDEGRTPYPELKEPIHCTAGGVEWIVRPTPSGLQVYMAPASACALAVVPVVGNVVNVVPMRITSDGTLLPEGG